MKLVANIISPKASENATAFHSLDLPDSDQDFDPTAEMLVNDFDDEHTLEEEEAIESTDSVTNELDDLQREGEMPLNEVLAMYGCDSNVDNEDALQEVPDSDSSFLDSPEHVPEKLNSPRSLLNQSSHLLDSDSSPSDDRKIDIIDLEFNGDSPSISMGGSSRPLLRSVHQASESSDTGTDYDYSPDEDWRKTIQVGSDFQAVIPEGLSEYDDAPAYENEDRLLWDPTKLNDQEVEDYLKQSRIPKSINATEVNNLPVGMHVRDDEQALFLLLQCGHNLEEALRRRRMQPMPPAETMSLWSEDECRSFETGLKSYGKDFHLIQINKVRTRAVSELIQFYYFWKKTERHDMFVSKNRIEKKKYALHPGTTDYMDRFLDEQENPSSARDRSLSPNSHIPMLDDMKKMTPLTSPDTRAGSSTPEPPNSHCYDILDYPSSISTSSTNLEHESSPLKSQSSNPSECSRDYTSGDDNISSSTPILTKDANLLCLNLENLAAVSGNESNHTEALNIVQTIPSTNCSHLLSDISRFHDGCNFRFDTEKDSISLE